jgi:hypothetical protein
MCDGGDLVVVQSAGHFIHRRDGGACTGTGPVIVQRRHQILLTLMSRMDRRWRRL